MTNFNYKHYPQSRFDSLAGWPTSLKLRRAEGGDIELLVAGVGAMVVGFGWYSMSVFGKPWMKEVDLTQTDLKERMKNAPKMYGLMFVGALIQAYVLSILLGVFGASDYMSAAQVAFWAWLGFVAPVVMGSVLFERRSWTYYGVTVGYQLVNMIVMSAILVTL